MPDPINLNDLMHAPVMTFGESLTLTRALLEATPAEIEAAVAPAVAKLKRRLAAAEHQWAAAAPKALLDSKAIDNEADVSWRAFYDRLSGLANLPGAKRAKAARAILDQLIDKDGLSFLSGSYPEQLAHMTMLLQRIEENGLSEAIDDLAGPEFLVQLKRINRRYDEMVGQGLNKDKVAVKAGEHLRELQKGISEYCRKVVATVDDDEPETLVIAEQALRPLAAFKAKSKAKSKGGEEPSE